MTTPSNGNSNLYEIKHREIKLREVKRKPKDTQCYINTEGKLCRDVGEECKGIFFKNVQESIAFTRQRREANDADEADEA